MLEYVRGHVYESSLTISLVLLLSTAVTMGLRNARLSRPTISTPQIQTAYDSQLAPSALYAEELQPLEEYKTPDESAGVHITAEAVLGQSAAQSTATTTAAAPQATPTTEAKPAEQPKSVAQKKQSSSLNQVVRVL